MIRLKICGITNYEDAIAAVKLGAHALGFIFAESPRKISPEKAKDIISLLPPFVQTVGVFVNEDPKRIEEIIEFCGLNFVQLHGDETPDICKIFMPRSIKAIRVKDSSSIKGIEKYKGNVQALLLDTYQKERAGGTGRVFDWSIAVEAKKIGIPIILSGGLGPHNIREAVSIVKPFAVDVNSGVESEPGKKSFYLLQELMKRIDELLSNFY